MKTVALTAMAGVRFASGVFWAGLYTSDLRIDFSPPIDAFGFWLIDNDFTDVRIRAFRVNDTLIETLVIPQARY